MWGEVARSFGLPPSVTSASYAIRQHYVRLLEKFQACEKDPSYLAYLQSSAPAQPRVQLPLTSSSFKGTSSSSFKGTMGGGGTVEPVAAPRSTATGPQGQTEGYTRLTCSLLSGFPNEVDFAFNTLTIMAFKSPTEFPLTEVPQLLDLILSHVAVFPSNQQYDDFDLEGLHQQCWNDQSESNFFEFWAVTVPEWVCSAVLQTSVQTTPNMHNGLFASKQSVSECFMEGYRVEQVACMLSNLTHCPSHLPLLSSHNGVLRFLLLATNCSLPSVSSTAMDALFSLAPTLHFPPSPSGTLPPFLAAETTPILELLFWCMLDSISSNDRMMVLKGLSVLSEVVPSEGFLEHIPGNFWRRLFQLVLLPDIQLVLLSLDTLYQFTSAGTAAAIFHKVTRCCEVLISLLTLNIREFGSEALAKVRVLQVTRTVAATAPATSTGTITRSQPASYPQAKIISGKPKPGITILNPSNRLTPNFKSKPVTIPKPASGTKTFGTQSVKIGNCVIPVVQGTSPLLHGRKSSTESSDKLPTILTVQQVQNLLASKNVSITTPTGGPISAGGAAVSGPISAGGAGVSVCGSTSLAAQKRKSFSTDGGVTGAGVNNTLLKSYLSNEKTATSGVFNPSTTTCINSSTTTTNLLVNPSTTSADSPINPSSTTNLLVNPSTTSADSLVNPSTTGTVSPVISSFTATDLPRSNPLSTLTNYSRSNASSSNTKFRNNPSSTHLPENNSFSHGADFRSNSLSPTDLSTSDSLAVSQIAVTSGLNSITSATATGPSPQSTPTLSESSSLCGPAPMETSTPAPSDSYLSGTPVPAESSPLGTPAPMESSPLGTPAPVESSPLGMPAPSDSYPSGTPVSVESSPLGTAPVESSPLGTPAPESSPLGTAPVESSPLGTPALMESSPLGTPAPLDCCYSHNVFASVSSESNILLNAGPQCTSDPGESSRAGSSALSEPRTTPPSDMVPATSLSDDSSHTYRASLLSPETPPPLVSCSSAGIPCSSPSNSPPAVSATLSSSPHVVDHSKSQLSSERNISMTSDSLHLPPDTLAAPSNVPPPSNTSSAPSPPSSALSPPFTPSSNTLSPPPGVLPPSKTSPPPTASPEVLPLSNTASSNVSSPPTDIHSPSNAPPSPPNPHSSRNPIAASLSVPSSEDLPDSHSSNFSREPSQSASPPPPMDLKPSQNSSLVTGSPSFRWTPSSDLRTPSLVGSCSPEARTPLHSVSPTNSISSSNTSALLHQTTPSAEELAAQWLQSHYEESRGSYVAQLEMFSLYLLTSSKTRGLCPLNNSEFNAVLRRVFPNSLSTKVTVGTQAVFMMAGLAKRRDTSMQDSVLALDGTGDMTTSHFTKLSSGSLNTPLASTSSQTGSRLTYSTQSPLATSSKSVQDMEGDLMVGVALNGDCEDMEFGGVAKAKRIKLTGDDVMQRLELSQQESVNRGKILTAKLEKLVSQHHLLSQQSALNERTPSPALRGASPLLRTPSPALSTSSSTLTTPSPVLKMSPSVKSPSPTPSLNSSTPYSSPLNSRAVSPLSSGTPLQDPPVPGSDPVQGAGSEEICYCYWNNCKTIHRGWSALLRHVMKAHVSTLCSFPSPCLWRHCLSKAKRSKFSLITHLQSCHCGGTDICGSVPNAQKTLARLKTVPKLENEVEDPLTKAARLTAALVLRNLAKLLPEARRHLRSFERELCQVALSGSEASTAAAQCLHYLQAL